MLRALALLLAFVGLSQIALAHGVSETDKVAMQGGGLLEFAYLGAKHMVTGYDHLLFIFGVIFFLTKFGEIVKFISAFTIGHSITLIFATSAGIAANPFLIDAVIALTVAYKGFDNLDGFRKGLKVNPPNMLALVFIFGLIHGFGLSTRLQEFPLDHDELLMEIIAFNLGVEGGQIVALTVMMLLLAGWRQTSFFTKFSKVSNIALIVAGFALFAMQINGYLHESGHDGPEHSEIGNSHTEEAGYHDHGEGNLHRDHTEEAGSHDHVEEAPVRDRFEAYH